MVAEIVIAVISAVSGGGIFKGFEIWISKKKNDFDLDAQFRAEYREKIEELEKDIDMLKRELRESMRRESEWKSHSEKLFFDFRQYQLDVYQLLLHKDIQAIEGLDTSKFVKEIVFPRVD